MMEIHNPFGPNRFIKMPVKNNPTIFPIRPNREKALFTASLWVGLYFSLIKTSAGIFSPERLANIKNSRMWIFFKSAAKAKKMAQIIAKKADKIMINLRLKMSAR